MLRSAQRSASVSSMVRLLSTAAARATQHAAVQSGRAPRGLLLGLAASAVAAWAVRSSSADAAEASPSLPAPQQQQPAPPAQAAAPQAPQSAAAASSSSSNAPANVYSWGSSQFGQTGVGDDQSRSFPVELAALKGLGAECIAAGVDASAAVVKGTLWTWGHGRRRVLGHGDTSNLFVPKRMDPPPGMTLPIKAVDIGENHAAAIDANGKLFQWGSRALGHLGSGLQPAPVDGLPSDLRFVSVACGLHHTLALGADGSVWALGRGQDGALGTGARKDEDRPVKVNVPAVKAVAAGRGFSLFLTADGTLLSAGVNDFGQLGQGTAVERYVPTPTAVRLPTRVKHVAAGTMHAVAVTEDDAVYTWGYGRDGQIGTGSNTLVNPMPQLVDSLREQKIAKVAAGDGHTAALTNDSVLYLWGRGRDGQLGRGDLLESMTAGRNFPLPVEWFRANRLAVVDVALGANHSVAAARPM